MDIKKEFKNRDRVIKAFSKDGFIRAAIVKNSKASRVAQESHNMPTIPAIFTARAISSAVLLASFQKGEERVVVNATGNGFLQSVYAEAMPVGEVRAYANYDQYIDEVQIDSISDLLGEGLFKVMKTLYNKAEPQLGIINLHKGDISSDLEEYLNQSEQIPSAVSLDVSLEGKNILHSGGLIIQAMPGANQEQIFRAFDAIQNAPPLSQLFEQDFNLEDILKIILPFEFDIISTAPVDFFCRCSKDSFKSKLITLKLSELKEMKKMKQNELVCQFCNKKYILDNEDFNEIIQTAEAMYN